MSPARIPPAPTDRQNMVSWYDPGQLFKTGLEVVISTIFGRHSDHRLIEALFSRDANLPDADYSLHKDGSPRRELWIDYVSDSGDGWNSTYAVSYCVAQPSLEVSSGETLPRGDVLIFGGDEVYPTASRAEYEKRFVAPYKTALHHTDAPHPDAFAIPGNHDWYDSLVSYTRLFCSKGWLGGWKTPQRRSYFAIKLPQGWWLLGTDVQLGSDIDGPQVEFFKRMKTLMAPDDKVILCNAEPDWIEAAMYGRLEDAESQRKLGTYWTRWVYGKNDPDASEHNLVFLEEEVLGRRVRLFLAGDLHHYRRHAADDGTQKITCGGGGAFLHPTSGPDLSKIEERDLKGAKTRTFKRAFSYPSEATCRWLAWRNLKLGALNPWLGVATGIVYALLGWALVGPGPILSGRLIENAFCAVGQDLIWRPGMVVMLAALLGTLMVFTDTHSPVQRIPGGAFHGVAHLSAMFVLAWAGAMGLHAWLGPRLGAVALMGVGGYFVGPLLLGIYLLVSLNGFGRHTNEAFSSLHIEDWKSFLRLHIAPDGTLTIYPIGIRRVPRRWRDAVEGERTPSKLVPDDAKWTKPELIEPSIPVTKNGPTAKPRV